ncbi:hypothetical protein HS088_TW10G00089 [Tripterygium wilfordii]|uniref:Uncharacterized protein n=1 Tax=Tripterygium wilfordii TaxID=458696 RepID=A0A7J7D414_TRIWF|nr:hypothetical protein HS088_TW10G00089 [Tripterygium wilfordii]
MWLCNVESLAVSRHGFSQACALLATKISFLGVHSNLVDVQVLCFFSFHVIQAVRVCFGLHPLGAVDKKFSFQKNLCCFSFGFHSNARYLHLYTLLIVNLCGLSDETSSSL